MSQDIEKVKVIADAFKDQPMLANEFIEICASDKTLAKRIATYGLPNGKVSSGVLRELIFYAAKSVEFDSSRIVEKYPTVSSLATIVGTVSGKTTRPKIVYTLNNPRLFEMSSEERGDVKVRIFTPDNSPSKWWLESRDGNDYLVTSALLRPSAFDRVQLEEIQYVLISDDGFKLDKTTMKSHLFPSSLAELRTSDGGVDEQKVSDFVGSGDWKTRLGIAEYLGELEDVRYLSLLKLLAKDERPEVAEAAKKAIDALNSKTR